MAEHATCNTEEVSQVPRPDKPRTVSRSWAIRKRRNNNFRARNERPNYRTRRNWNNMCRIWSQCRFCFPQTGARIRLLRCDHQCQERNPPRNNSPPHNVPHLNRTSQKWSSNCDSQYFEKNQFEIFGKLALRIQILYKLTIRIQAHICRLLIALQK